MRATNRQADERGFTLIQVVVIVALATIITAFGAIGIVNARAHMRLSSSARQFTTRIEKARGDSVRRHAMGTARANVRLLSTTSYAVNMDVDGNGFLDATDTRVYNLESDVTFAPAFVGTIITFDWRGRSVTGQVAPTMRLFENVATTLITISGSGDITLDAESFPDGSIPELALNGTANPDQNLRPDPPPNPSGSSTSPGGGTDATPTPTPPPDPDATPTPYPTPTPTPCNNNGIHCREDATPTPTPAPTATPTPDPTPDPDAGPCTISPGSSNITLGNKGTAQVLFSVANTGGSITVTNTYNNNPSHISVTLAPGQTGIVNGSSGSVKFNIVMNGNNQSGMLVFTASAPCSQSASVGVNQ